MKEYQKYILILVLIFVFYFFGNRFGKLRAKNITAEQTAIDDQIRDFGFTSDSINKSQLTYPEEHYKSLAVRLQNAFGLTDDEETIYDVFRQMRTDADVKQLILAFGAPRIIPNWHSGAFAKRRTLIEVIQLHLTRKEIVKINEILSQRNINYRF